MDQEQKQIWYNIIYFMQSEDKNGTWHEILDELDHDNATYVLETIEQWLNDGLELTPRIEGYIKFLQYGAI